MSKAKAWPNVLAADGIDVQRLNEAIAAAEKPKAPPKPPAAGDGTKPFQVWLTPTTIRRLKIAAIDKGVTASQFIADLLRTNGIDG